MVKLKNRGKDIMTVCLGGQEGSSHQPQVDQAAQQPSASVKTTPMTSKGPGPGVDFPSLGDSRLVAQGKDSAQVKCTMGANPGVPLTTHVNTLKQLVSRPLEKTVVGVSGVTAQKPGDDVASTAEVYIDLGSKDATEIEESEDEDSVFMLFNCLPQSASGDELPAQNLVLCSPEFPDAEGILRWWAVNGHLDFLEWHFAPLLVLTSYWGSRPAHMGWQGGPRSHAAIG
ncbi:hypothetical protein K2173_022786 [Erythroxylum novogranatense]|uniref:Uncharacterized protein n=1 Tax=Erythroxylum novogranatense TaxID=1862640 RepID=A0AAV8SNC8_9ROSI|nr:hypothetical protein K2173_022786 [Erythroxylum novogranatense]